MPSRRHPDPRSLATSSHARILVVLVLTVFLAGCSGILADDAGLPSADEASAQYDSLEGYSASFSVEMRMENETQRWNGTVAFRPGTGEQYQQFSRNGNSTTIFVSNESTQWIYETETENVTRMNATRDSSMQRNHVERLVAQANGQRNETVEPGIPTAPVVPSGGAPVAGRVDPSRMETRYEGTETVGDRTAHVIVTESTADAEQEYRRALYLDTEWFVPLSSESEMVVDGEQMQFEYTLANVTFNPDIPDDRFEFDPPENATIETSSFVSTSYDTREELASAVEQSVPNPDVPDRFEFDSAQRSGSENFTSVTLQYSSGTEYLGVSRHRSDTSLFNGSADGEQVTVDGRTATYRQIGPNNVLTWRCGADSYSVTGKLSKAELVDVAESIDCA